MKPLKQIALLLALLLGGTAHATNPIATTVGPGAQFTVLPTAPQKTLKNALIWFNSADGNKPYYVLPNGSTGPLVLPPAGPGAGTYGGGSTFVNSITVDKYGLVTAITASTPSGGGGGGGGWSFVDAASGDPSNVASATGGSFTVGGSFKVTAPCHIVGARYYWAGGFSTTIKVSVWDPSGTRVATTTVAVTTAGIYSVTFGSSIAVTSGNVMKNYFLGTWDTGGNGYTHVIAPGEFLVPGRSDIATQMSTLASGLLMWTDLRLAAGGDAKPTGILTSEMFPVDITLTSP